MAEEHENEIIETEDLEAEEASSDGEITDEELPLLS